MESVDLFGLLVDSEEVRESAPWGEILDKLSDHVGQAHSGARIKLANPQTSETIANSRSGAWLVAPFGEPATILVRRGLDNGLALWHATRLVVALNGSPSGFSPGELGVLTSSEDSSSKQDKRLDHLTRRTLRSMGVSWLLVLVLYKRYKASMEN